MPLLPNVVREEDVETCDISPPTVPEYVLILMYLTGTFKIGTLFLLCSANSWICSFENPKCFSRTVHTATRNKRVHQDAHRDVLQKRLELGFKHQRSQLRSLEQIS